MCTAIAIVASELPLALRRGLTDRVYVREGREEVQFHWWKEPALLPVQWGGNLRLVRWGSHARRSSLPYGGWIAREQLEAGIFGHTLCEEGIIPANMGRHRGTWFLIVEGIRAVVLPEFPGGPVAYMLMEPATNYYRNMTEQSPLMPVFVNQVI
jgi:hypothetical protein